MPAPPPAMGHFGGRIYAVAESIISNITIRLLLPASRTQKAKKRIHERRAQSNCALLLFFANGMRGIFMETSCSYTDGTAWVSSDEPKMRRRILELSRQYPDDVVIKRRPEDNDGCIYATVPSSWFRIMPKRACYMTDEQREAAADRMRKLRAEMRVKD